MQATIMESLAANRWTYLGLFVVGQLLCSRGIGKVAAANEWLHPLALVGYALGAFALLLLLQGFFRFTVVPVSGSLLLWLIVGVALVKVVLTFFVPRPSA